MICLHFFSIPGKKSDLKSPVPVPDLAFVVSGVLLQVLDVLGAQVVVVATVAPAAVSPRTTVTSIRGRHLDTVWHAS